MLKPRGVTIMHRVTTMRLEQLKYSTCMVCKTLTHKVDVTSYCLQCSTGMCSACLIKHDKRHLNHSNVSVTSSTIEALVCHTHDKHVHGFCVDCSCVVCRTCTIGDHRTHRIYNISCDATETDEIDKHFEVVQHNIIHQLVLQLSAQI